MLQYLQLAERSAVKSGAYQGQRRFWPVPSPLRPGGGRLGTADKGFLSYWRYPTLSEAVIREHLMEPLAKHRAVMAANVVTGYVDHHTKRILVPWAQKFTDRYGVRQDYGSTRRGLLSAVAAGVVEIESHGWTHMQPDLDSPPGPWWDADLDGEASASSWYEEFSDRRRGVEAPALAQLFHLKRSLDYLHEDVGQRALSLRAGGGAWSRSYVNHTGTIAAEAGFGLLRQELSSISISSAIWHST